MTSVQAGEVEAVHALTTEHVWDQQGVAVEGQTDILTMGLPYISPYNVNSILNPILVACLGLGYFFNLYRGKPLVREGGVLIMTHPTPWEFNPVHHPSYIDFFEQVLSETTDPIEVADRFEESFATDPWYIHLYRTGHAYHGVHPFYMWYWCAHALQHLGGVIIVGGEPAAVHRLGFRAASTLADALEMATGRGRPVPVADPPPRPAHPDGRRAVTPTGRSGAGGGTSSTLRSARAVRADARPGGSRHPGDDSGPGRTLRRLSPSALAARLGRTRFPLAAPSWPESVPRPAPEPELGVHYDTAWSRRYPVRLARAMVLDNVTRPVARVVASPLLRGDEGLDGLEGPVIFAANHASHIDTPLLLSCLPLRFRHRTVVAAAADYFFDRRWKADAWSFLLAAIPIERNKVNRRSADLAAELLADDWNLIIFPEGGRSPDGWAQEFTGGAAYLASRTGARWCRCTSTGPATSCPRGARGSAGPGPPSPSAPRCGPRRARTPAASASASKRRWPPWPTRPTPTGGRPASRRRPARPPRSRARTRRPGDGRGCCPPPRNAARPTTGWSGPGARPEPRSIGAGVALRDDPAPGGPGAKVTTVTR